MIVRRCQFYSFIQEIYNYMNDQICNRKMEAESVPETSCVLITYQKMDNVYLNKVPLPFLL
jgi:hypothetical protein